MALNKAIKSGKEHRKQYKDSKAFDCTCRNHGTCIWCTENRTIKNIKRFNSMLDKLNEMGYNI